MSLLLVVAVSAVILSVAYWTYGGLLSRLLRLDPTAKTPAFELRDDIDYAPLAPNALLSQHFSAIAAAGPIVGPILAGAMFGWLPALIWILVGAVFVGGVHDLTALTASIRQVHVRERQKRGRMLVAAQSSGIAAGLSGTKEGRIITLFAPKGGVGRTTLAVNLAVAMAGEQRQTVTLVDGSFQFGDVGVLLNLNPKNKSIIDVVADSSTTDDDLVDTTLINHSTGIKVLLAHRPQG